MNNTHKNLGWKSSDTVSVLIAIILFFVIMMISTSCTFDIPKAIDKLHDNKVNRQQTRIAKHDLKHNEAFKKYVNNNYPCNFKDSIKEYADTTTSEKSDTSKKNGPDVNITVDFTLDSVFAAANTGNADVSIKGAGKKKTITVQCPEYIQIINDQRTTISKTKEILKENEAQIKTLEQDILRLNTQISERDIYISNKNKYYNKQLIISISLSVLFLLTLFIYVKEKFTRKQ